MGILQDSRHVDRRAEMARVADLLPPRARKKTQRLAAIADDLDAAAGRASERHLEAWGRLNEANQRVREISSSLEGSYLSSRDKDFLTDKLADARRAVAVAQADYDDADDAAGAVAASRAAAARDVCNRIISFVRPGNGRRPKLRDRPQATMKPADRSAGEWRDAIDAHRRTIEDIRGRIKGATLAQRTAAEARATVRAFAARLVADKAPDVMPTLEAAGDDPRLPSETFLAKVLNNNGHVHFSRVDLGGLALWLFKDQLVAALEREVDDLADDAHALDVETRAARIADLSARLFEAECEEEAMIEAASKAGLMIDRRKDADVRAILGVVVE